MSTEEQKLNTQEVSCLVEEFAKFVGEEPKDVRASLLGYADSYYPLILGAVYQDLSEDDKLLMVLAGVTAFADFAMDQLKFMNAQLREAGQRVDTILDRLEGPKH